MGFLSDVIYRLSLRSGEVSKFFDKHSGDTGRAHLEALQAYVTTYQPHTHGSDKHSYGKEMDNRLNYFLGAMREDMEEILKRQFENTYEDYIHDMINLRLVRSIIMDRAQAFPESTRYALKDRKTNKELDPNDPNAREFQDMIEDGLFHVVSRNADALCQLCHRVALKVWWDEDVEDVRLSAYPPQNVLIVRNPDKPWSPYSAPAVLFRHSNYESVSGQDTWEVWATGDFNNPDEEDKDGLPVYHPTSHYLTDGDSVFHVNQNDENPFRHPRYRDRPFVPYVWMADDAGTDLYTIGDEDLLTANRTLNWGLTSLHINLLNQSFAIPYFKSTAGKIAKIPRDAIISPKKAFKLPKDVEIGFASPNLDVSGPVDFYKLVMKLDAMFSGLDSDAVTVEGKSELTGRALRLKQVKLDKVILPLRKVYRNPVEQILEKAIIVRNYYADRVAGRKTIDVNRFAPKVVFGDIQIPVDPKEEAERFILEKEHDVSTSVDWRMRVYGESKEEAEKAVENNAKKNEEERKARRVFPMSDLDEGEETPFGKLPEAKPPKNVDDEDDDEEKKPTKEEVASEGFDLAKLNIYQLIKLRDADIITSADIREIVFGEDPKVAAKKVQAAIAANLANAKKSAKKAEIVGPSGSDRDREGEA